MSPIKDLNLVYEALNKEDTFSQGDTIAGTLTFTLTKETKVKVLTVKAKGDARVHWTHGTGDNRKSYNAHRRYLKLKEHVVAENEKGTVLPKGDHHFKFRFTIPQGDMPSSFKGLHGKIVYMLEAKVSRSWRMPSTVQKELKFVSKSFSHRGQVMCPQSGSVDKKMSTFSKGEVQMSATINTNVCSPGDNVAVVAKIHNSSSKQMKPKYSLQQKIVYRANAATNISDQSLCKMVGEIIAPNSEESVSCQLTVPADVIPTLHDCEILTVEYYFKVYLDISFAIDPEVVFPLVIVPSGFAALQPGGAGGPYPAGARELGVLTQLGLGVLTQLGLGVLTQRELGVLTQLELWGLTQRELGVLTQLGLGVLTQRELGVLTQLGLGVLTQRELGVLTQLELWGLTQRELGVLTQLGLGVLTQRELGVLTQLGLGVLTQLGLGVLTQLELGVLTQLELWGLTQRELGLLGPQVTATSLPPPSRLDLILYLQVQVLMATQHQIPLNMQTYQVDIIVSGLNRLLHTGFQLQLHPQCSLKPLLLLLCFNRDKNLHRICPLSPLLRLKKY
ncbi:arrestin domain-containing protein 3-like [Lycodopsis pacificus]